MELHPTKFINYGKIKVGLTNFFSKNKGFIILIIFILFYLLLYFLIDYSTQSLVAHDEGLYARRARLIEASDNWFSSPFPSPHHKTLGSYWLIALSIKLFGYSELALRLPSILCSFLCIISTYLIALKVTNKKSALISLFSLSSMPLWIQYSKYASPDVPFVLCILLVILFFLKSLDTSQSFRKYLYIFISGLFISTSFFLRSYMALVPIIGLTPFLIFQLCRQRSVIQSIFCSGIFVGSIPTFFNLFFAVQKFGESGITSLFDFAKNQAIGDFVFSEFALAPLNFLYLTFPTGILFIILFIFTKSNYRINYPLLIYCFPLLSLTILLCMSTSYSHYYLFLLPSLSILFAVKLSNNSFRFSISKLSIKYLLLIIVSSLFSILLFFIFNFQDVLLKYSNGNTLILFIILTFLLLSYISSIRFLLDIKLLRFNLLGFFYNIVIPQYISMSLLFNFGILGNPNFNIKLFLKDKNVSSIINSNTICLYSVDSKIQTLLSYYLPSSQVVYLIDDISKYKYVITSDINSLDSFNLKKVFKSIKKFDNQILLLNSSI